MSDPADLNRLREALKWTTPVRDDLSSNSQRFLFDIYIDAARSYRDLMENGEQVDWCTVHRSPVEDDHGFLLCHAANVEEWRLTAPCSSVERRLVPDPEASS